MIFSDLGELLVADQIGPAVADMAHIQAATMLDADNRRRAHALQVLIENAIGKAKRKLKDIGVPVPVSAYDAFAALATHGLLPAQDLPQWNAIVGLRNRLVHDYMNVDITQVLALVEQQRERFVVEFLLQG